MLLAPGVIELNSPTDPVAAVVAALASRSRAIFVRDPPIDPTLPETSDLDFLLCADVDDLTPERLRVPSRAGAPARLADLAWLPTRWLDDAPMIAAHGLVPHRLLGSRLVFDAGIDARRRCDDIRALVYQPELHRKPAARLL